MDGGSIPPSSTHFEARIPSSGHMRLVHVGAAGREEDAAPGLRSARADLNLTAHSGGLGSSVDAAESPNPSASAATSVFRVPTSPGRHVTDRIRARDGSSIAVTEVGEAMMTVSIATSSRRCASRNPQTYFAAASAIAAPVMTAPERCLASITVSRARSPSLRATSRSGISSAVTDIRVRSPPNKVRDCRAWCSAITNIRTWASR
jgi:hypothetical protein